MSNRPFRVLLAEDSDLDVHAIRRCFCEVAPDSLIVVVKDGRQCVHYLLQILENEQPRVNPRPDLLLLDLAMPEFNGFQVLARIKQHPDLRRLPVIVLANNPTAEEVERCYDLGANAVFPKPMGARKLAGLLELVFSYWNTAALPDRAPAPPEALQSALD